MQKMHLSKLGQVWLDIDRLFFVINKIHISSLGQTNLFIVVKHHISHLIDTHHEHTERYLL